MSWERTEGRGSGSGSKDLSNAVTWEQRPDCRGPRARQRSGRSIPDTQNSRTKALGQEPVGGLRGKSKRPAGLQKTGG